MGILSCLSSSVKLIYVFFVFLIAHRCPPTHTPRTTATNHFPVFFFIFHMLLSLMTIKSIFLALTAPPSVQPFFSCQSSQMWLKEEKKSDTDTPSKRTCHAHPLHSDLSGRREKKARKTFITSFPLLICFCHRSQGRDGFYLF